MSDNPITVGSTVSCPHGFKITLTGSSRLTIDGKDVITATTVATAAIACTAQSKCTVIKKSTSSILLTVDNAAVVLGSGLETNIGAATVVITPELLSTD